MPNTPSRIVAAVDDDFRVRESLSSLLESAGFTVVKFASGEDFLRFTAMEDVGCLITDVRMTGMDGLELQRVIRERSPSIPVIFISAHNDCEIRGRANAEGAAAFFFKPFDGAELLAALERVFRWRRPGEES